MANKFMKDSIDQVKVENQLPDEKLRHVVGGVAVSEEDIDDLLDDLSGESEEELVGKRGPSPKIIKNPIGGIFF